MMIPEHPLCFKRKMSHNKWSQYIKGVSAVFAWHISRGERGHSNIATASRKIPSIWTERTIKPLRSRF
ncbi:hypothetical protein K469DRAFT_801270 [Zopfia rhizophila CBS 207.26]|uniref:Uncharacterized protein n=1 Tax=Zopfia rhizophila CBS 207.26 TaxID=1314779 RepID=A0A6A6EMM9_9PEZI|nr:hypothetical protein K469DRAFT_801270 [Zopfia rhizophila CBS 207.26]